MSRHAPGSHWKGPLLGDPDAMAGALEDFPLGVFADTRYTRYFNDFQNATNDYVVGTEWTESFLTAGSAAVREAATASEGVLRLNCPADNQGPILQLDAGAATGSSPVGVTPTAATAGSAAATDALMVCRFKMADVSESAIFVGLAETHAAGTEVLLTTNETTTQSDVHIGFHQIATDAGAIRFTVSGDAIADKVEATGTSVIPAALADGEYVEVAVRCTGVDRYRGYVKLGGVMSKWRKVADGTLASGNTWDTQMVLTLANVGSGTAETLDVDYVMLLQKRDLIE